MQKLLPDFGKLRDLARKNFALIITLCICSPVFFLLLYFLFPGNYTSACKIQLRTSLPHLVLNNNTGEVFREGLNNKKFFSQEEVTYFNEHVKYKDESNNVLSVIFQDSSSSRLQRNVAKAIDTLRERLGTITPQEKIEQQTELEKLIAADTKQKMELEDNFKALESVEPDKDRDNISTQIAELKDTIEPKQKQLEMIQGKIASGAMNNRNIFEAKANDVRREIDELISKKNDLEQKLTSQGEAGQVKETLEKIVALEKSIDINSKRLAFLLEIDPGNKTEVRIPYFFGIQVIEPPTKSFKVYTGHRAKRTVLIGILFAIFLIVLVFIYNTSFNQIISSVDDLEKITDFPVIGAIYEIKKR